MKIIRNILSGLAFFLFLAWIVREIPVAQADMPLSDIIFLHETHEDLECADCHNKIEQSETADDNNLPVMDDCGECHDIEAEDECGICHRNPEEPGGFLETEREIVFNHMGHFERGTACRVCHRELSKNGPQADIVLPAMKICLECHDGIDIDDRCGLCHGDRVGLTDIHPPGWKHSHNNRATTDREWCGQCHHEETSCLDCHRGDNLTGNVHELNYVYTHGLDAGSKATDCVRCHDRKLFCNNCHESENRIPLLHSTLGWLAEHGRMARNDIENCASCHDSDDPTCARGGCHNDTDGIRGTNPRIHPAGSARLDTKGPWHNDDGYLCYQCHVNTRSSGMGFCGYCHN